MIRGTAAQNGIRHVPKTDTPGNGYTTVSSAARHLPLLTKWWPLVVVLVMVLGRSDRVFEVFTGFML